MAAAEDGPTSKEGAVRTRSARLAEGSVAAAKAARAFLHVGHGRLVGVLGLVFGIAVMLGQGEGPVQTALFDTYQQIWPRVRQSLPVVIVEIDERTLAQEGQWPWPRTRLADLTDQIALAGPAAIGYDIFFSEPDRLSPDEVARRLPQLSAEQAATLASLPSNDSLFATSLALAPAVLALAGLPTVETPSDLVPDQILLRGEGDPEDSLVDFQGQLSSLPTLVNAALGQGLINGFESDDGITRRPMLVAHVRHAAVAGLGVEMLRVALLQSAVELTLENGVPARLSVGALRIPVEPDGGYRLHFAPSVEEVYLSAADVLDGTFDRQRIENRLVLIGMTGLGLQDYKTTPAGDQIPGVEIHAQLLESILDGAHLSRPPWAPWLEVGLAVLAGGAIVAAAGLLTGAQAVAALVILLTVTVAVGPALFVSSKLVIDSLSPAVVSFFVALVVTSALASIAIRDKGLLHAEVERRKEQEARLKGELEAARRIQLGLLPNAARVMDGEHRVDLEAFLEPALEVGGDFYDVFFIDADHLFFLVGDVSGKGIPASLFMAISKAMYKNAVLRRTTDIGAIMTEANREIARENPEMLFVTAFAAILDLRSGDFAYCNAGHDSPLVLSREGEPPGRLDGAGGPPLCVLDDFDYESAHATLTYGQALLVTTDGITEAMDPAGALYGSERLDALVSTQAEGARAAQVIGALLGDVRSHARGAPPSDDITVMFVRYLGTDAASGAATPAAPERLPASP